MLGNGRPFRKGVSGNPGGRPKVLGDVQELARQQSPLAIETLAEIMSNEKTPPAARVAAAGFVGPIGDVDFWHDGRGARVGMGAQ